MFVEIATLNGMMQAKKKKTTATNIVTTCDERTIFITTIPKNAVVENIQVCVLL